MCEATGAEVGKMVDQESNQNSRPQNPLINASFLSQLLFKWPLALLKLGLERSLTESDLADVLKEDESSTNKDIIEGIWQAELDRVEAIRRAIPEDDVERREKVHPSFHRALLKYFFSSTWVIQPFMLLSTSARIVMSVALGYVIQSFEDGTTDGYWWAAILVACNIIVLFEHHHVFFITWRKGMQMRTGLVAAIFAKSLRLKGIGGAGDGSISSGQVMNLVSNDVERFLIAPLFISYLFWAPVQAIITMIVGYYMIGPSFAIGIAIMLGCFVPLQYYLMQRFAVLRSKVAAITDARVTLVSQVILGARVMKMSGWEWQFNERIAKLRRKEVHQILKSNRLKGMNEAIYFSVNVVISIIIFIIHIYTGRELTPRVVFTVMSFVGLLQLEMAKHFSIAVMAGSECWVSTNRIQKFLESTELTTIKDAANVRKQPRPDENDLAVSLSNVTCNWYENAAKDDDQSGACVTDVDNSGHSDTNPIALDDINLDFMMNSLTCVVGPVGSGKSALLLALAGELTASNGKIDRYYSSLSFAPQDPWIMNGSVKDNILLGLPFDVIFYNEIVNACGLSHDFSQFPNGEETIVGDRGVQCSGGQRARIGLARALYRDADVVLLDDPLSAVDSRVGRLIFYSAIQDLALKRGKCVVLATHQHQYIGEHKCVLMLKGRIEKYGSFTECVDASNGKLHHVSYSAEGTVDDASDKSYQVEINDFNAETEKKQNEVKKEVKSIPTVSNDDQEEKKAEGILRKETVYLYARAMGSCWMAILLLCLCAMAQVTSLLAVIFSGRLSERPFEEQTSPDIVGIVVGLGGSVVVLSIIRALMTLTVTIQASKRLHDAMTKAVLRAKIEFFDTNPSGRILNRFSADVGSNDDLLPTTLFDFLSCSLQVAGALITSIVALPFILIIIPFLLWYFFQTRKVFVTSSREIKRIEGLARSPIFSMISESLNGVSSIRANDAIGYFNQKFKSCHNGHCRAFFAFLASSRWVGFRMDFIMFTINSCATFLAVLFSERGWFNVDPVIFGLALSMLIQLGSLFQWTVRQSAEVVNQMIAVERVAEFSNLPPEAELALDTDESSDEWPKSGSVEINNLALRYRPTLPLSLNGVSFSIKSGQRVGVVGRTGSGKSTLVQALFRVIEAERGNIIIDGIDTSTLGLHKLRKGMSVINQYPFLFSGSTIRENLDPFDEHDDDLIRESLNDVQMMNAIDELPDGLDSIVEEGGSNFSVGQRQLLCVARAILRKSKILVLDEPTANVDGQTDKLLQEAVNKSFQGATIISVAHRLDTIIENDLILVLGDGLVLEFGSPSDLLSQDDGHFSRMVNDTGEEMSSELRKRATLTKKESDDSHSLNS